MARQSITLTPPNDEWLKSQVSSEEYSNKSEVVNALIRKEREIEARRNYIRSKLIRAEKSGFTDMTAAEILTQSKDELRRNGKL